MNSYPATLAHRAFPRPWASWLDIPMYFLLWSIPGLAALSFYYLNQTLTATAPDWQLALISTLPNWYIWGLMAPAIVKLTRTYPLEEHGWVRVLTAVHLPLLVVSLLIHSGANLLLFRTTGIHQTMDFGLYKVHFLTRVHANLFTYATIVGLVYAYDYYRKYTAREQQAVLLQVQLAQANLRALKMQVHPHFLFNTLHSIAALVRKSESKLAVNMLGQLGEFLRLALENKGRQEIPLHQELDFLARYLAIEKTRFSDRLEVNIDAPAALQNCYVPNMILQPIVENAIHHGISPSTGKGCIDISVTEVSDQLCLSVTDSGPGVQDLDKLKKGVGVGNTRDRLENLYGPNHVFSLQNSAKGGLEVRICVPIVKEPVMALVTAIETE